jgi:hypothetical protein
MNCQTPVYPSNPLQSVFFWFFSSDIIIEGDVRDKKTKPQSAMALKQERIDIFGRAAPKKCQKMSKYPDNFAHS